MIACFLQSLTGADPKTSLAKPKKSRPFSHILSQRAAEKMLNLGKSGRNLL